MKILFIVTSPITIPSVLGGQMRFLREAGFEVTVVSGPGPQLDALGATEEVITHGIEMEREISPWSDLKSLFRLHRYIRQIKPDVVNVGTPKAGLIGGLAAFLARVPRRVYTLHGLRLETAAGWKRIVLGMTERVSAFCAHRVVCVSSSLRNKAIHLRLVSKPKAVVLGRGSCNGVDRRRFSESPALLESAAALRAKFSIPHNAVVLSFIGRFVADKGISPLGAAFERLSAKYSNVWLLMVGDFEPGDPVGSQTRVRLERNPQVVFAGVAANCAPYYHASDIVLLPTRREGFPTTVLEAHCAGKPVVAFRATGTVDAIRDGVDGLLCSSADADGLFAAIEQLINDREFAVRLGLEGSRKVNQYFQPEQVWQQALNFYQSLRGPGDRNGLTGEKESLGQVQL